MYFFSLESKISVDPLDNSKFLIKSESSDWIVEGYPCLYYTENLHYQYSEWGESINICGKRGSEICVPCETCGKADRRYIKAFLFLDL